MNDIAYGMVQETYYFGTVARISYGIAVYSWPESEGTVSIIASAHDVSSNKDQVEHLVCLCNRDHLEPKHLNNIVEDFLSS